MNVVQLLSNPAIGGTETFAIGLAAELERQNVRCRIVNLSVDAPMEPLARAARVPYVAMPMPAVFDLAALRRFHACVMDGSPDVICAYGLRASLILRTLVVRRSRPLLVTGLRGLDGWRSRFHVGIDRLTQSAIDCFVGNSRAVCELRLQRERSMPRRVVCIPNGIDAVRFSRSSADERDARVPEGTVCLTVANFREVKGYDFLLRALRDWDAMPSSLRFVWVGDGPEQGRLVESLRASGLEQRVVVLNGLTEIRSILASADFFVLPSREEGMPRALMEAMAMGLPCIATRVGGVPELIRDGQDGKLIEYGDVPALRRCISDLTTNGTLRSELGVQAAARIREGFEMRGVATQYTELFTSLLAAR